MCYIPGQELKSLGNAAVEENPRNCILSFDAASEQVTSLLKASGPEVQVTKFKN